MDVTATSDDGKKLATADSSPENFISNEPTKQMLPSSTSPSIPSQTTSDNANTSTSTSKPTEPTDTSIDLTAETYHTPTITPATEKARPIMLSRSGTSEALKTVPSKIRSTSPHSDYSRSNSTDSVRRPDLSNEVAALSAKLIQAANVQSGLDDALQTTRHDLEAARKRIAQLEEAGRIHQDLIDRGLLIRKQDHDEVEIKLNNEVAEERRQKIQTEREKKAIELELENLTSALFEEANTMVIAARKEREVTEKKNEQLNNQLRETQILLASQQEQLQDLKLVMQQLSSDRDDNETNPTTPSTPAVSSDDKANRFLDAAAISPTAPVPEEIIPDHPLHFSHLVRPVMRTDLPLYDDFKSLLKLNNSTAPQSRVGSGNYSNMAMNMKAFTSVPHLATTGSTDKVPLSSQPQGARTSPTPTPLKDTKFYKRTLAEDIEPTLRLDIAPSLSWLARRSVLASIASSSLVIEPFAAPSRFHGPIYACALCGENRRKDIYLRRYRFCTSDAEDAQRYPLCDYCLGRVRASCDYTGFLRIVRDGLWKTDSDDEAHAAWDECVRLRERMFWSRLGGGVVPLSSGAGRSEQPSPKSGVFDGGRASADGLSSAVATNGVAVCRDDDDESDEVELYGDAESELAPEAFLSGVNDGVKKFDAGSVRTVRVDSAHADDVEEEDARQKEGEGEKDGTTSTEKRDEIPSAVYAAPASTNGDAIIGNGINGDTGVTIPAAEITKSDGKSTTAHEERPVQASEDKNPQIHVTDSSDGANGPSIAVVAPVSNRLEDS